MYRTIAEIGSGDVDSRSTLILISKIMQCFVDGVVVACTSSSRIVFSQRISRSTKHFKPNITNHVDAVADAVAVLMQLQWRLPQTREL